MMLDDDGRGSEAVFTKCDNKKPKTESNNSVHSSSLVGLVVGRVMPLLTKQKLGVFFLFFSICVKTIQR
jgi:hypothetical protein